jgi:hypothetical protein
MIVVRNVFRLKFGKTREAVAVFKEGQATMRQSGFGHTPARVLTDLVSSFYTLVLEQTFDSLADYESSAQALMANNEWKAWYQKVLPLVESGHREIFTIVE